MQPVITVHDLTHKQSDVFPVLGELDPVFSAEQQRKAEFLLKLRYDMADARLRIAEALRRCGQIPEPDRFEEHPVAVDIHKEHPVPSINFLHVYNNKYSLFLQQLLLYHIAVSENEYAHILT